MTEVIVSGFVRRTRSRELDLNKNPVVYDYTDNDGWDEWYYSSGKSAGINPMIYTSEAKARQNSTAEGIFKRQKYIGFGSDQRPKYELLGYREIQTEILPVDLVFSVDRTS